MSADSLRRDSARQGHAFARPSLLGIVALAWGTAGFALLLITALARLAGVAIESLEYDWAWFHYAVFAANLTVMAWFEGYRGFQRSYSPRFAARARHLLHHATPAQALLAPLACMGFLWATRRRLIVVWTLTVGIILIVAIYRALPQPWRGILDAGVFVGLGWGLLATLFAVWAGVEVDPEFTGSAEA